MTWLCWCLPWWFRALHFSQNCFLTKKSCLLQENSLSEQSDTCSIKRFCRRCKAHSFKVVVHSACPFRNCQCPDCSKIAQNSEVARERARKHCTDQTAALTLVPTSTDIPVTVQQVLQLGKNNSQADQDRKWPSISALQASTYQLNLRLQVIISYCCKCEFCAWVPLGKQFYPWKYGYC